MNKSKCSRCGRCCSVVILPLKKEITEDEIRWLRAHQHLDVKDGCLVIKAKCKHLGFKNGQHYCKIYENRPEMCKAAGEKECLRNGKIKGA